MITPHLHLELHDGLDTYQTSQLWRSVVGNSQRLDRKSLIYELIQHLYLYLAALYEAVNRIAPLIDRAIKVRRQISLEDDIPRSQHRYPGPPLGSRYFALYQLYLQLLKSKIHNPS